MKKLISIILAVMLVSALAVTSFAAPTVDYVFNADGFSYVFGSLDDEIITDMGLKITNKNNVREYAEFSALDSDKIDLVNNSGKFGFGIQANGMLKDSFTIKPYCETANGTVEGLSYVVNPENKTITDVPSFAVVAEAEATISESSGSNLTASAVSINSSSRNYFLRFDISGVNSDASDIILTFGSNSNNSSYASMAPGATIKLSVYAAEGASESWTSTSTLQQFMGNPAGFSNDTAISSIKANKLGEVTDCIEIVRGSGTKESVFTLDVTEYVKAQKAAGNTKLSIMIDADTIAAQSYPTAIKRSDLDNSVPKLTWK